MKMTTNELTASVALPASYLSAANVGGTDYLVTDVAARTGVIANREEIDDIKSAIEGGVHFIGKTTTELSDGSSASVVVIDGENVTAKRGDMVVVDDSESGEVNASEYIYNGSKWYQLGSVNDLNLGDLAFVDSVQASYTPSGTIGISSTADDTASFSSSITCDAVTGLGGSATYNEVSSVAVSTTFTPTGTVTYSKAISASFSSTETELTAGFTGSPTSLTCNATLPDLPSITVDKPTVTVNVPGLSVSTTSAVAGTATVTNGVLSFNFNNVLTAAQAASAGTSELTATVSDITADYNGTYNKSIEATGSVTAAGSVSVQSFTPTGTVSLAKETAEATVSMDAMTPTFSTTVGTKASTAAVSVDSFTPTGSVSGSVTIPGHTHSAAFAGTAATITSAPAS